MATGGQVRMRSGCARAHMAERLFCGALLRANGMLWVRALEPITLKSKFFSLLCNFASKPPFFI
jgi:hypothetical protein